MRKVYLIRHGRPDFPGRGHYCLGRSDMPLGVLGRLQACQLGYALGKLPIEKVFSSPLSRATETAGFIRRDYAVLPGLEEMDAGDWDGLCFTEIKERWPELYARRGGRDYCPIPNSEDPAAAQGRFAGAVQTALDMSQGDIAVVAHTTVNQSLISMVTGERLTDIIRLSQPYCSYYELKYDGALRLVYPEPICCRPALDRELALRLMNVASVPDKVIAHCEAVAIQVDIISHSLQNSGLSLDCGLIHNAALLHDIARLQPEHPQTGAQWLRDLGYAPEAELVRQHHELDHAAINEAAVLYIADKCVMETETVPISRRFEKSFQRCQSEEARSAHERRFREALSVQKMINDFCREEVIK